MLKFLCINIFLFSWVAFDAEASATMRNFNEFIPNSDLIIYGEVREINFFDDNSGFARLNVESVFKGAVSGGDIIFKWGSSYTEQKLTKVLERHILFLKSDGSEYIAALSGVSVWDVVYVFENPNGSVVRPMPVNGIPALMYSKPGELDCTLYRNCSDKRITLETFTNYMKNEKSRAATL